MRSLRSGVATLIVAAGLALAATMLVPAVLGFDRYVITGDSMTGSYDRGSIIFERPVPVSELRAGDVITFEPPGGAGSQGLVTHRILEIKPDQGAGPVLRTKGDANAAPDPWEMTLEQPTQARAAFGIPYVGYAFAALSIKWVRMLVIGLPALLVAVAVLAGLWRESGAGGQPFDLNSDYDYRGALHGERGPYY